MAATGKSNAKTVINGTSYSCHIALRSPRSEGGGGCLADAQLSDGLGVLHLADAIECAGADLLSNNKQIGQLTLITFWQTTAARSAQHGQGWSG